MLLHVFERVCATTMQLFTNDQLCNAWQLLDIRNMLVAYRAITCVVRMCVQRIAMYVVHVEEVAYLQ